MHQRDPTTTTPGRVQQALPSVALLAVFGLIGLNLRTVFGAVPSLLDDIGHDLLLSGVALSLLTSIPVVCMGLLAPAAQRVAARIGHEHFTTLALVLLTLAEALRLGAHRTWVLYLTTLMIGAAIGGVSTVMPGLIGHHVVSRPGLGAGIYSTAMAVGSTIAAGLAVPLAVLLGGWNVSLATWAVPTAVTTALWLVVVPRLTRHNAGRVEPPPEAHGLPWRNRTAWLVTTFFVINTLLGFSVMTWLAPAYRARGWDADEAGRLLSVFFVIQVVAMLVLPSISDRTRDRRPLLAIAVGCGALGLLGFAAVPSLAYPSAVLFGLGIGGAFALSLVLLVDVTASRAQAARLSAMVFLVSYCLAAVGPVFVGVLRDATGGYAVAFWLLFVLGALQLATVPGFRPGRTLTSGR